MEIFIQFLAIFFKAKNMRHRSFPPLRASFRDPDLFWLPLVVIAISYTRRPSWMGTF
jgi:hypothetical protein